MTVKLLSEHTFEFEALRESEKARLSLHLSKCYIVGNHMSSLIMVIKKDFEKLIRLV